MAFLISIGINVAVWIVLFIITLHDALNPNEENKINSFSSRLHCPRNKGGS